MVWVKSSFSKLARVVLFSHQQLLAASSAWKFNNIKALGKKFRLREFQLHWNNPAHISTQKSKAY
jgi:hypothetical protein